ncbi:MAG: SH3 domain-containing protein, partial [Desulfovibrionaceae bacterium]|nr:SH3 domain-containing protein [Desulfovibrionaceae bacterium]
RTPDAAAPDGQSGPTAVTGEGPATTQPSQEPAPQQIVYIGENTVRLRANPDTESDILLTLDPGTRLTVWENTGDWIKVTEPGGQTGYVHSRLTASSPPDLEKSPAKATKPASRRPKKPAATDQGWKIVK